jgi:glycosyltransferase involved in cell wall biosynthesis
MRIGLDLRPFLKQETGIGVYFKNLLHSLARIDQSNEYFLFSSSWKDRFPSEKVPAFNRKDFRDFRVPVKVMDFLWYRLGWPPLEAFFRQDMDLTHSATPLILPAKGKKIVTVHDLFFMDYPGQTDKVTQKYFFRQTARSLRAADGVITVSFYVKNELLKKFDLDESCVKVVYHGRDKHFEEDASPDTVAALRKKYDLPETFILFVGAMEARKNLPNLATALKIIHDECKKIPLVIAGRKGPDTPNFLKRISQNQLEPWVRILDYLPFEELHALYHSASLLVYPSFCEGFGFPLLEAMASGLPIVTAEVAALPEIAQDAALYCDPFQAEDIAWKAIQLLSSSDLCQTLVRKGKKRILDFDWEKTAFDTLDFYHALSCHRG